MIGEHMDFKGVPTASVYANVCSILWYYIDSERAVPSKSCRKVEGIPMRTLTQLLLALAIVMALAIVLIVLIAH